MIGSLALRADKHGPDHRGVRTAADHRVGPRPSAAASPPASPEGLVRKRKSALRKSAEHLSATLRSIGDGVTACDRESLVVRLNAVAQTGLQVFQHLHCLFFIESLPIWCQ